MTVMPRIASRKSKQRRSSFVTPANRSTVLPDPLSWLERKDSSLAPKGPAAWMAASMTESGRTVIDAGPYGVVDLAAADTASAVQGRDQQLGVVWWDKRSFREEDDDFGEIQTSFVPAAISDHVSLAPLQQPADKATTFSSGFPAASSTQASSAPASSAPAPFAPAPFAPAPFAPASAAPAASFAPRAQTPSESAPAPASAHVSVVPVAARAVARAEAVAASAPPAHPPAPAPAPQRFAPPISASVPVAPDEAERQGHARRSRHVALVPKSGGRRRRTADSSHPRRSMLRRRRSRRRFVLGAVLVIIAFAITVLVQSAVVTPFTVPSVSMQNTLTTGDRILVDKVAYGTAPVNRGDVVVFSDPGGWLSGSDGASGTGGFIVKRVIGLPGDTVSCCSTEGRVVVNGIELYEPYAVVPKGQPASSEFEVTVPAGELWVLGDNRYNSRDSSRTQELPSRGFVPIANVIGRAALKVWPLTQLAPIPSAKETFSSIPNQTCPI